MFSRQFEYGSPFSVNRESLLPYLVQIWEDRKTGEYIQAEKANGTFQPFLTFDGNSARACNYVGFIQMEDFHLEIYPKVFQNVEIGFQAIYNHLFFWFSYCRRWRFPVSEVNLSNFSCSEFPELIINLIADQILHTITEMPLTLYEEQEASVSNPKGRINIDRYVSSNLSRGNAHILECDFEQLTFDNRVNRVIKYVARVLVQKAKLDSTKLKLNQILFLLDDVTHCLCFASDLNKVRLNSFYSAYEVVLELCKLVLSEDLNGYSSGELSKWNLLLPMEYVFEDFLAGFIEKHFSDKWRVKYQQSGLDLTDEGFFNMQHDIFLISRSKPERIIIIDAKYKLRGNFKSDNKKGIAQSDLYQVVSYAIKRGCTEVILLYPNQKEQCLAEDSFNISTGFNPSNTIKVTAAEVPFWTIEGCDSIEEKLFKKLNTLLK